MRGRPRGAAALGLAAARLKGCVGGGGAEPREADPQGPVDGGTWVVGLFSDHDSLNEFVSTDAAAADCMENARG